jgi:hypothetical protein
LKHIPVILEIGSKRTLAFSTAWPGWCRGGRDEASALQALLEYAPRYAQAMEHGGIKFALLSKASAFTVTERVTGNATTDFGAPAVILDSDREPVSSSESKLWQAVLHSCWQTFDDAVKNAVGKELRKGPRGGGRELEQIVDHVLEADGEYLKKLAWRQKPLHGQSPAESILWLRDEMERALVTAIRDGLPAEGPRGGVIWPRRYFVRRAAWHVLDHAWEIEDRVS